MSNLGLASLLSVVVLTCSLVAGSFSAGYSQQLAISWELRDAINLPSVPTGMCYLSPAEKAVLAWLRLHENEIINAEKKWNLDRRAIAGVIAWEALNNVKSKPGLGNRWIGPGKVHYYDPYSISPSTAEETEKAGYLPIVDTDQRQEILSTTDGSINYIGGIMRADADAISNGGYNISYDPVTLGLFYNAWKLDEINKLAKEKKFPAPLSIGDNPMANWILHNLKYLEDAVGKPFTTPMHDDECSQPVCEYLLHKNLANFADNECKNHGNGGSKVPPTPPISYK